MNDKTRDEMLKEYYREYPEQFYIKLPEFIIKKLGLDEKLLTVLPEQRNRDIIHNWMIEQNFSASDLTWIGW